LREGFIPYFTGEYDSWWYGKIDVFSDLGEQARGGSIVGVMGYTIGDISGYMISAPVPFSTFAAGDVEFPDVDFNFAGNPVPGLAARPSYWYLVFRGPLGEEEDSVVVSTIAFID
jgi:hypothetical protein